MSEISLLMFSPPSCSAFFRPLKPTQPLGGEGVFYGKTKAGEVEESHKEEKFGDICICIHAQTGPPQEDDIL